MSLLLESLPAIGYAEGIAGGGLASTVYLPAMPF